MAKKSKKKKSFLSIKMLFYAFFSIIIMVVFLPTTFLLVVGMFPTIVAAIIDSEPGKNKTLTVGTINFAGCFPYLLQLWMNAGSMDLSIKFITTPEAIVVMYGAATIGYIVDWFVTMLISTVMIGKSKSRIKSIEEEKKLLEKRWGVEVSGRYDLDENGFIIEGVPTDSVEEKQPT